MFQNDNAILAAVTLPKFKCKLVESQNNKDLYVQQILIQQMSSLAADDEITVVQDLQDQTAQSPQNKKDDFYDFKSDDEFTSESGVNIGAS